MKRITILGGGSWGTALAIVLSRTHKVHEISLWVRDAALAESIRSDRENPLYLPGHKLPDSVQVTHDARCILTKRERGRRGNPIGPRSERLSACPAAPRAGHTDCQRNERARARHPCAHE